MHVLNWTRYAQELLNHSILHLKRNSEFDLKMALICIDNAVEIIIKEFLNQPKGSYSGPLPSYSELSKCINNFYELVGLCVRYKPDIIDAKDIDIVLRYHKIRNLMYHDGSGITVSTLVVEEYIEIAKILFFGLYGFDIKIDEIPIQEQLLGIYLRLNTEYRIEFRRHLRPKDDMAYYWKAELCMAIGKEYHEKHNFIDMFNMMFHTATPDDNDMKILPSVIDALKYLIDALQSFINSPKYQEYLDDMLPQKPINERDYFPRDIYRELTMPCKKNDE